MTTSYSQFWKLFVVATESGMLFTDYTIETTVQHSLQNCYTVMEKLNSREIASTDRSKAYSLLMSTCTHMHTNSQGSAYTQHYYSDRTIINKQYTPYHL